MPGKQKREDTLACGTKLFATLDKKFNCGPMPQANVLSGDFDSTEDGPQPGTFLANGPDQP
jgi:hypothetical protein